MEIQYFISLCNKSVIGNEGCLCRLFAWIVCFLIFMRNKGVVTKMKTPLLPTPKGADFLWISFEFPTSSYTFAHFRRLQNNYYQNPKNILDELEWMERYFIGGNKISDRWETIFLLSAPPRLTAGP